MLSIIFWFLLWKIAHRLWLSSDLLLRIELLFKLVIIIMIISLLRNRQINGNVISSWSKLLEWYISLDVLVAEAFYRMMNWLIDGINSSITHYGICLSFTGTVRAWCLSHSFTIFALVHTSTCTRNNSIHACSWLAWSWMRWVSHVCTVWC